MPYGVRKNAFYPRNHKALDYLLLYLNSNVILSVEGVTFSAKAWWTDWPSDLLRGIDCYHPSEYGTVVLEIRLLVFTGKEGLGYVDIR